MKSNIKKIDTTGISEKMVHFFSDPGVEETARQTQFVRRKSAITGLHFLKAMVLGFLEKSGSSLNELDQSIFDVGVEVTPQGVDERINAFSGVFCGPYFRRRWKYSKTSVPYLCQFCSNSVRSTLWIAAQNPYRQTWPMNIRVVVESVPRRP